MFLQLKRTYALGLLTWHHPETRIQSGVPAIGSAGPSTWSCTTRVHMVKLAGSTIGPAHEDSLPSRMRSIHYSTRMLARAPMCGRLMWPLPSLVEGTEYRGSFSHHSGPFLDSAPAGYPSVDTWSNSPCLPSRPAREGSTLPCRRAWTWRGEHGGVVVKDNLTGPTPTPLVPSTLCTLYIPILY